MSLLLRSFPFFDPAPRSGLFVSCFWMSFEQGLNQSWLYSNDLRLQKTTSSKEVAHCQAQDLAKCLV